MINKEYYFVRMKTKFTFKAFLLPIVLIAILCLIIFILPDFFISPDYNDKIFVKQFFGLIIKKYSHSEIEGWKYSHQSDSGGTYEVIFLYNKKNKVINVSQSYHRNYLKLKDYIQNNFNHLGYEKFSYINEFKEMFK